jgi:hypothetical protein
MLANLRAGLAWLRTGLAWALLHRLAAIVRWRDRLVAARAARLRRQIGRPPLREWRGRTSHRS